eukprot:scaffold21331_cov117-Isochrysis_galbana.AAC.14
MAAACVHCGCGIVSVSSIICRLCVSAEPCCSLCVAPCSSWPSTGSFCWVRVYAVRAACAPSRSLIALASSYANLVPCLVLLMCLVALGCAMADGGQNQALGGGSGGRRPGPGSREPGEPRSRVPAGRSRTHTHTRRPGPASARPQRQYYFCWQRRALKTTYILGNPKKIFYFSSLIPKLYRYVLQKNNCVRASPLQLNSSKVQLAAIGSSSSMAGLSSLLDESRSTHLAAPAATATGAAARTRARSWPLN